MVSRVAPLILRTSPPLSGRSGRDRDALRRARDCAGDEPKQRSHDWLPDELSATDSIRPTPYTQLAPGSCMNSVWRWIGRKHFLSMASRIMRTRRDQGRETNGAVAYPPPRGTVMAFSLPQLNEEVPWRAPPPSNW